MVKDFNNLPSWLPRLMGRKGLTAEKLAQKSKVSRTSVYLWLKDKTRPDSQTMVRVCRALGVPLEEGLKQYTHKPEGNPHQKRGASAVRARR